MIFSYKDIFAAVEGEVGATNLTEFRVCVKENSTPHKAKVRPLNLKQKESLWSQLDMWVKQDVIEESESPWASTLVPVLKKDGTTRWEVDYHKVNEVIVSDAYPLPNISKNLEKLQGSSVFSSFDAAGAYHIIPVKKQSRPILEFTSPFGTSQY